MPIVAINGDDVMAGDGFFIPYIDRITSDMYSSDGMALLMVIVPVDASAFTE